MAANIKHLVRKLSNDIRQLYYLLEKNIIKSEDGPLQQRNEIHERLSRINEDSELLQDITYDLDWDNRTNRKFQKFNTILLIVPTVIGLVLLFGGITKISATKEVANKLTREINQKDSLIKEYVKVISVLTDSTKAKIKLSGSLKTKMNQKTTNPKANLNTTYFRYDFSGKSDSIDLKSLNVDLLILNNATDKHLYLSVINPRFSIKEILYTSADPSNSFDGADGQTDPGQFVIISVAKLKQFNQYITLQLDTPSLKERPPYQLLTLILK